MALNPSIILAGQQPNFLRTLSQAATTAGQTNDVMQANALRGFLRDSGDAVMRGDPAALADYSRFSPKAALGVQQTRQGMRINEEQLRLARAAGARAAQQHQWTAEDREEAARNYQIAQQGALLYDRAAKGEPDAVAQFNQWAARASELAGVDVNMESFPILAATLEGAKSVWEGFSQTRPQTPKPMSGPGKVQADIQAGFLPAGTPLRGAGVTVENNAAPQVGTIPQGYMLVKEGETYRMAPIPGGPADTTQEDATAAQNKAQGANIVLDEISIARDLIANESLLSPATGITGSLAANVDTTRGGQLKNRLETIKANIGFDKLQAMRDASPTGGALGQVSEFENRLLQAVFGSLVQSQDAEQLDYNLQRLETIYRRIIDEGIPENEARALYRETVAGDDSPPQGISPEDWKYLTPEEKALFK